MFKLSLIGLALLVSTAAAPAAAEPATVTHIVRTADLDLGSEAGRKALDRRISRAAIDVCGEASEADLEGQNAVRLCRDDVIAEASQRRDQLLAAAQSGRPIILAARD